MENKITVADWQNPWTLKNNFFHCQGQGIRLVRVAGRPLVKKNKSLGTKED